jgi:hypothetical protein
VAETAASSSCAKPKPPASAPEQIMRTCVPSSRR